MEHTSTEKIAEALNLLEQAAREKKDELKNALSDKYTHLKTAIVETEHRVARTLTEAGKQALDAATQARDAGVEKVREVASDVDKSVHRNPWPYLAGTAVTGLLLGYLLGRSRK